MKKHFKLFKNNIKSLMKGKKLELENDSIYIDSKMPLKDLTSTLDDIKGIEKVINCLAKN